MYYIYKMTQQTWWVLSNVYRDRIYEHWLSLIRPKIPDRLNIQPSFNQHICRQWFKIQTFANSVGPARNKGNECSSHVLHPSSLIHITHNQMFLSSSALQTLHCWFHYFVAICIIVTHILRLYFVGFKQSSNIKLHYVM